LIEANVRLSQEVEDRRRAEQALRSLLESSDRERQLISYDIHDGLAQQMAGAKMAFDAYGHLKRDRPEEGAAVYSEGLRLLDRALAEVRRLIGGLRPPILDEQGVVAAIEHFVHDTRNHLGLEIECHSDVGFYRLEPTLESALLRIVQEGVTNAHKHSRSNRIHIGLSQAGQLIRLEIRDWGVGFDPKATTAGFGLEGIRQRARLHGGDASVESSPGQGTLIVVNLPVVERKEDPGSPPGADAPHGAAVPSTG
jgi:two-component system sensor histidine kinase DegS